MGLQKQKWTAEEEATLRAGVTKYGPGKWKAIKQDIHFGPRLICRSNVDIKDKWRNLNVDPTVVESTRKRSRDPEENTRDDINRNEKKALVAVQAASSGVTTPEDPPEEEKLPLLPTVEDANEEAEDEEAYEAEASGEAARGAASTEVSEARTYPKEATLAVLQAVEKAEAAVAIAKSAAIEAEAAVARAEAAKTAAAAAAEIERAQAARAVAAEAEAEATQEARKAATLVEQLFSLS